VRKYYGFGHAIDRPVDGVESRFSCPPLLYHEYRPIFEFRANGTKVLSRKNMVPSFEDAEHKETCMPSLSGQRGGTQNAKRLDKYLSRLYNVVLTVTLTSRITVYYTLYRIHIKCGVLLEISMSSHQLADQFAHTTESGNFGPIWLLDMSSTFVMTHEF
jgi:hypothetical protein